MKLFVSPHNDDACLFGAFTLLREKPVVLTVYDSYVQVSRGHLQCAWGTRRNEDIAAIRDVLGCEIEFLGLRDDVTLPESRRAMFNALTQMSMDLPGISEVWLPAAEKNGHDQHNLVGQIGLEVFKNAKVTRYSTYTRTNGKSSNGTEIKPTGAMVLKKLQALARYKTQIEIDGLGCWPHFMDLREYVA